MGAEQSTETENEEIANAPSAEYATGNTPAAAGPGGAPSASADSVLTKRLAEMEGVNDLVPVADVLAGARDNPALALPIGTPGNMTNTSSGSGSTSTARSRRGLLSSRTLQKIGSTGSALLSWRPKSLTARGPVRGKTHTDPKQVFEGLSELSVQCALNQPRQLKSLLAAINENAAALNAKDSDGDRAPLHWAAARGHLRCINYLVSAGADTAIQDKDGRTPAELAILADQELAADLLKNGPPLEDPKTMANSMPYQMTHLSTFAALNQPTQLRALLRSTGELANPNLKDHDNDRAPIHWAAARGHVKCIEILLSAGADIGVLDKDGTAAAGLAMQCNQRTAYDLLLRALKGEYVPDEAPPTTQVKFQASTVPTIVEETAQTASQLQSI